MVVCSNDAEDMGVLFFIGTCATLIKAAINVIMCVCLSVSGFLSIHPCAWNSAPTGWIFMKFNIRVFLENPWSLFKFL